MQNIEATSVGPAVNPGGSAFTGRPQGFLTVKISDLKAGMRIRYTWAPGNSVIGTVLFVVPHASRASRTVMRTDSGGRVKLHHKGRIELLEYTDA